MKIYLVNSTPLLVKCLQSAVEEVSPYLPLSVLIQVVSQLLQQFLASKKPETTALVAPANSFSFMGGGFDKAILNCISSSPQEEKLVEEAIQNHSLLKHCGFLPPTQTHTIPLSEIRHTSHSLALNKNVTSLIQVPTMEVPEKVVIFDKVFCCTWAALEAIEAIDVQAAIFPAFGAGYGGVPPGTCARLMVGAIALRYMLAPSPLAQSAGVILYLRRKYLKLGKASDIAAIESFYTPSGINLFTETGKESQHWPLPWHRLVKGLNWVTSTEQS